MILLAAVRGSAWSEPMPAEKLERSVQGDFWRDIVEPHGAEVRDLIVKARSALKIADDAVQLDSEWAVDQRMRYVQDAYGMLRYARRLSPENAEVITLLGRAADDLGRTRQAIEAFDTATQLVRPDQPSPELYGRLGAIYLRLGDRDAAIRWLRRAQGPLAAATAPAYVHLANALAARGEVTVAVDTLANLMPPGVGAFSGLSSELALISFALAVIYDRDEQRSAAFDVLDKMQASLQAQYGPQVQNALALIRFAPAEDQHYYLGLLYESQGQMIEARTEWALYAASGEPTWRARALEHVGAIDAQRRAPAPKPVTPAAPTPTPLLLPGGRP